MKTDKPGFKGWDWTELWAVLGLPEYDNEDEGAKAIRSMIYWWYETEEVEQIEGLCREYLEKLYSVSQHCCAPLYRGLLAIEEPCTFLKYFGILLETLWS